MRAVTRRGLLLVAVGCMGFLLGRQSQQQREMRDVPTNSQHSNQYNKETKDVIQEYARRTASAFSVNRHDHNHTVSTTVNISGHVYTYHGNKMVTDVLQHNITACTANSKLRYIIYVYSAPQNIDRRDFIRQAWGQEMRWPMGASKAVFILGRSDRLGELLKKEMESHGDIVIGDFVDSYKKLTYKGMVALKWVTRYCRHAKYVFKVDDDVTFNIEKIIHQTEEKILQSNNPNKLTCIYAEALRIRRGLPSYIATYQLMGETLWPPFCLGGFYGFSMPIAKGILENAEQSSFFLKEDVFFTGFMVPVIKDLKITYLDVTPVTYIRLNVDKPKPIHLLMRLFDKGKRWIGGGLKLPVQKTLWKVIQSKITASAI